MSFSLYNTNQDLEWKQAIRGLLSVPYSFYCENKDKEWDYKYLCKTIEDPTQFIEEHYAEYKREMEKMAEKKRKIEAKVDEARKNGVPVSSVEGHMMLYKDFNDHLKLHFNYLSENPFVTCELREKYPEFSKFPIPEPKQVENEKRVSYTPTLTT